MYEKGKAKFREKRGEKEAKRNSSFRGGGNVFKYIEFFLPIYISCTDHLS